MVVRPQGRSSVGMGTAGEGRGGSGLLGLRDVGWNRLPQGTGLATVVGAEAVRGVAQPHDLRVDLERRTDGMS